MKSKMFLIFNHRLTETQKKDAMENLGVSEFIYLPESLQVLWGNVPPELPDLKEYLQPIKKFLSEHLSEGDKVLIQGDFGACCALKEFVREFGAVPIYATTRREVVEEQDKERVIKKSVFKHIAFREYP